VAAPAPAPDTDASFTLDVDLLAERRAASARRVHTVQIPRFAPPGFAILCVIAVLPGRSHGPASDRTALAAAVPERRLRGLSWAALRAWYGRTGPLDLGLLFLHLDSLVWLFNLRQFEQAHLFFACLCWCASRTRSAMAFAGRSTSTTSSSPPTRLLVLGLVVPPGRGVLADRLTIAATMYLLGIYLAFTGLVSERLRRRVRQAMHAARELVDSLEHKKLALETQARDLEEAGAGRAGQRRQGAVPGDRQPRDPHADERRARHHRAAAADAARRGPAPSRRDREPVGDRAARLIDDVLDLSRIEASKLTLNATPSTCARSSTRRST
jgi:hypothetical protein